MDFAVEVEHLRKVYPKSRGQKAALEDLSFKIPTGRVYGLIGRNGAGKTTFVRIAATQLGLTSGSLSVLGMDVATRPREVRARIACVPQESRPLYFLNTEEVVYLYLKMRGMDPVEARRTDPRRARGTLPHRVSEATGLPALGGAAPTGALCDGPGLGRRGALPRRAHHGAGSSRPSRGVEGGPPDDPGAPDHRPHDALPR